MNKGLIFIGTIVVLLIFGLFYVYRPTHTPTASPNSKQASSQTTTPTRLLITTATYHCDKDRMITAAYYQGPQEPQPAAGQPPTPTGSVDVSIGNTATTTLSQTLSADGSRYATPDESLVFWNKGDTALIMRNNSMDLNYTNCVAVK